VRVSSTIPSEGEGETPSPDPIRRNAMTTVQTINDIVKNGRKCQRFAKLKELQLQRTGRPELQHF